jgi:hypothetical protein
MTIPPNIAEFWQSFCAHVGADRSAQFFEAFHFDDNEPSANALAELVLVWCANLFCTYLGTAARAALARVTFARMSDALAVQMNGLGRAL